MIENQTFPLVILPENDEDRAIVVRIDGRLSTEAAYFNAHWERHILQDLERLNIAVLSIWSYNWWKDAKEEAERLSNNIGEMERDSKKI